VQQNRVFGALTFAFLWVGGVWFLLLRELKKKKKKKKKRVVVEEFCKCKEVAMAGGKRKSEDDGQSLNTRVAPVSPCKNQGFFLLGFLFLAHEEGEEGEEEEKEGKTAVG
jgi:hypothetical protein